MPGDERATRAHEPRTSANILLILVLLVAILPSTAAPPSWAQHAGSADTPRDATALLEADVVGFADPGDDAALFDHRLPDWGYRATEARLALDARGSDEGGRERSDLQLGLGGDSFWYRESEQDRWWVDLGLRGGAERDRQTVILPGTGEEERETDVHQALTDVRARWRHYAWGDLGWVVGSNARFEYRDRSVDDGTGENTVIGRSAILGAEAGLVYGRHRDVTPVVRAERIAERLVALGRSRPTRSQVLALADQLARREGYVEVYQRAEKFFWPPLLAVLDAARPFTPLEVLYLVEVLEEPIVGRAQGWTVETVAGVLRQTGDPVNDLTTWTWTGRLDFSHNLDLHQQLFTGLRVQQSERSWTGATSGPSDQSALVVDLTLGHLWQMVDRLVLQTSGSLRWVEVDTDPGGTRDDQRLQLRWTADYFVEDHLSLRTSVRWADASLEQPLDGGGRDRRDRSDWIFGLELVYLHDRILR